MRMKQNAISSRASVVVKQIKTLQVLGGKGFGIPAGRQELVLTHLHKDTEEDISGEHLGSSQNPVWEFVLRVIG